MAIVFIAVAVGAAFATAGTGLLMPAIVNAAASFWSNGVLANYARESDPSSAPNWAAAVSMITTIAAIALLIGGLLLR